MSILAALEQIRVFLAKEKEEQGKLRELERDVLVKLDKALGGA